ncbi:MAG: Na/Pi cotransporter family protein, partial [Cohaesibacteraceae bacterium]|nr:Na/Pi cotransporter family protein [Cohaesibacteraceae bacterium]
MGSGTIILIEIVGAVVLLLWGIRMVRTGFERYLGADLRRFFAKAAGNRFKAVIMGAGLASALQSSTAVVIMATGFASRGALELIPGLAFVLGADIGTSIAAQVLSFKVAIFSPAFLIAGYILFIGANNLKRKNAGRMSIGLGLIFMALQLIGSNAAEIGKSDLLGLLLQTLGNDIPMAILFTVIMTWIIHSSLAMVLFIVALVASGTLSLELGLVFVV